MDWHWRPQSDLLMFNLIDYDHIGQIENFAQDLDPLFDRFGSEAESLRPLSSQKLNATGVSGTDARNQQRKAIPLPRLTLASVRLIQDLYAEDFSRFGYDLQPPLSLQPESEQ